MPNSECHGIDVNKKADCHEEINCTVTAGNKCYFSLILLLKCKRSSNRTKVSLYKVLVGFFCTTGMQGMSINEGTQTKV